MYKLPLEKNDKECFPKAEVELGMYLLIMVTNSSGEKSFSKLKLIKNRLRRTMSEYRLNFVSLVSVECDILKHLSYEDVPR